MNRIDPKQLKSDGKSLDNLGDIEDYDPKNTDYTATKGETFRSTMEKAQASATKAETKVKAARNTAAKAEHDFHSFVLGAKRQVVAQYGADSDEVESVGLKRKSNYRKRNGKNGNVNGSTSQPSA